MVRIKLQRETHKRGARDNDKFLFPVGKINQMTVYPMTFDEFLKAGKGRKLWKYIENQRLEGLPEEVRASVDTMLDAFLVTGGMPEAVNAYYKNENFEEVDAILQKTLDKRYELCYTNYC